MPEKGRDRKRTRVRDDAIHFVAVPLEYFLLIFFPFFNEDSVEIVEARNFRGCYAELTILSQNGIINSEIFKRKSIYLKIIDKCQIFSLTFFACKKLEYR